MKILENKSFKDLTTFRIGGRIKYYAEVKNSDEIFEALDFAVSKNLPIFLIGGGSDFLASEKIFDGLVIKYTGNDYSINGDTITAEGGMIWDDFVKVAVENKLGGIECLSGIPGTVGASPVQNIGAYGQEMKDTFFKLEAIDVEERKKVEFGPNDCKFGYRESIFKDKKYWQKYLILSVSFKLKKGGNPGVTYESLKGAIGENPTLLEVREAVLKVRAQKLEDPKEFGNAGSFFKNPIVDAAKKKDLESHFPDVKIFPSGNLYKVSAAWLIDKTGLKGKEVGGAVVSTKHALILINKSGSATADDVFSLSDMVINEVFNKFGVRLEREVQLINF